ncbi:MAG: type II secretion system protein [Candidatus Saccharibacteria bacterium]|nr:type II secretion system protein [Candidatus Saccharibacteria bacterium]
MKKSQKGFTIIEVALVLAIGALIFLVVFLAVPALQRNQRNDARKRDVSTVVDAVASFVGNNPTANLADDQGSHDAIEGETGKGDSSTALGKYIDTVSTNIESVVVTKNFSAGDIPASMYTSGSDANNPTKITVVLGAQCDGTTKIKKGAARSTAVIGGVETTGAAVAYCSSAN